MNAASRDELLEKLSNRGANIGVIGLGYVGLPLLLRFVEAGYMATGFDIDSSKIENLKAGQSYLKHIPIDVLSKNEQWDVTTDFSRASEVDAIILCVPTPLDDYRQPDLSYVTNSVESVLPYMHKGQVMSLESTTYPGTTEEELRPRLEQAGFKIGEDVFLVYSPEREDPGNANFNTQTIPKVCSGSTDNCREVARVLYGRVVDEVVPVSSTQVAEMTKILENTYRAVNIALVNELKMVADKMDIDIFEVIRAAATKPFGYTPFYPGPGLGGHCIPIDPFYLTWKAREYGVATRFIELAGQINTSMPNYVVSKVTEALNSHGKSVKGSKVLVLGIAYKKNIDDTRESPGAEIIAELLELGADVAYSDPHVPKFPPMRKHQISLTSTDLSSESISRFNCVLVVTAHDAFPWDDIVTNASLIVDSRGVLEPSGKIFHA